MNEPVSTIEGLFLSMRVTQALGSLPRFNALDPYETIRLWRSEDCRITCSGAAHETNECGPDCSKCCARLPVRETSH